MATQIKNKHKATANIAKQQADIERKKSAAKHANDPAFLNMLITESFSKLSATELDFSYLLDEINQNINQMQSDNLAELEALLLVKQSTANYVYEPCAAGELPRVATTYMNLALKS